VDPTTVEPTETSGEDSTETSGDSGTEESTTDEPGLPDEGIPKCGNGTLDDGEECDDGMLSMNGPCLPACILNICGDGNLNVGVEVCDEGEENGDYGGSCDSECSTDGLEYCGDGTLQMEFEACEAGDVMDDVPCNPELCTWGPYRIVFLTSKPVRGDLQTEIYEGPETGVARADLICQQLATDSGREGTFHAWLSDNNNNDGVSDAAARIGAQGEPTVYYVMPGGGVLAESWGEFLAERPNLPINRDEHGLPVESSYAWTNTGIDGLSLGLEAGSCGNWTSVAGSGWIGAIGVGPIWTNSGPFFCAAADQVHLYCIEGG